MSGLHQSNTQAGKGWRQKVIASISQGTYHRPYDTDPADRRQSRPKSRLLVLRSHTQLREQVSVSRAGKADNMRIGGQYIP